MEGPKTTGKTGPGQRHCRHSHGKHGHTETLPVPPNSTQEETVDDNPTVEITVADATRPVTSSSDRKAASPSPRPASRRYDTRPSSTRSAFEHIPGTRPASRRDAGSCDHSSAVPSKETTISRSSNRSRKSRPTSTGSGAFNRGQSSDSDSDDDHKATPTDTEFHSVDILDEKAFDTDLEVEAVVAHPPHMADGVLDFQSLRLAYCEQVAILQQKSQGNDTTVAYDHSGKTGYIDTCKRLGVVPASYFLRHMNDRHLSMSHHGLGPSGMKALAEALAANTRVLKLDLSDNWLGKPGGVAVCEMLKENCFITDLNLSDNRLGNDCAPHLAQIMQQNVTLLHIILSGNEFDDNCAVQFAEAIMNTTKIQYLDLSHNHFGDVAGTILGPAIADNTCIKELNLSWNSIRRNGAVAITQGLKNNVYMKSINLSWNGFGLEGAIGLQDALKGNGVLEELDISNNRITAEGAVLIGKGLSSNETLKILKMGKNPMQSAGCFGICAAILRNPNCILESVDFTDILVNKDFEEVYQQVLEQLPNLKLRHGGMEPEQKPKAKVHPMVKLCNYIEKHELRLVDFFNKFDKDGSMSVTHEEFVEGIETARMALLKHAKETGIKLSEEEIEELLQELDRDGDGEINYNELVVSHVDFQEKREQINTVLTVMQPRPMTT